jgi:hypothetical protein
VRFPLQRRSGVRTARNHRGMFQVTVVCSSCAEETEVVAEDLGAVEREVCPCGYSYVVLSVADFEPVHGEGGQLIQLRPRRDDLERAA